jgi:hypothetical protein
MTRRLAAVVLASYPLAYRRRYGEELAALVDDSPVNGRVVLDLLRGAVVAHLRPVAGVTDVVAPDDRLRASMTGVLACWVAFAAAGFAFAVTTDDGPFGQAGYSHPLLGAAHGGVQLLAVVASLVVVAGALPLIVIALWRARDDARLRPWVSLPFGAVVAFAGLTAVLVVIAHGEHSHRATIGSGIAFLGWALAGLGCGAVCVFAARRVLFAVPIARRWLLCAYGAGAVVTAAMFAIGTSTALYAITLSVDAPKLAGAGNGPLHPTSVAVALALQSVVMALAAVLAATSMRRGWSATGNDAVTS